MKRQTISLPSTLRAVLVALVVGGGAAFAGGLVLSPARAWTAYLTAAFSVLGPALGALVLLALLHVAKAGWGVVVKRVVEGVASYLPWGAGSIVVLLAGMHTLYPWAGPHGHDDPILQAKSAWLNVPGFALRMGVVLALWLLFARLFRRWSLAQDTDDDVAHTRRAVALSAGFLVVFALSFSVASFDWLMSLSPHWQSTIFAWYQMAGVLVSALAVVLVAAIWLHRTGALPELRVSHVHDLAKLLFAMSTFWAYLWVSQYLLIWYANMPEETAYYLARTGSGYHFLFWINLILGWLFPFVMLLSRTAKRSSANVLRVCAVVLLGRWLDVYLQVAPSVLPEHAGIGLLDVVLFAAFAAGLILVVERALRSAPLLARGDPYLVESLHHDAS